jgi:hypothetical protein
MLSCSILIWGARRAFLLGDEEKIVIQINILVAFIGMGIVIVTVTILWCLADKGEKRSIKKSRHFLK